MHWGDMGADMIGVDPGIHANSRTVVISIKGSYILEISSNTLGRAGIAERISIYNITSQIMNSPNTIERLQRDEGDHQSSPSYALWLLQAKDRSSK